MKKIKKWHIWGFLFISLLGTFLHFTYDISNQNQFIGYFSAVNESVWEHLKLIFFPFFIWTMVEYFIYGKTETDYFAAKATAVFCAMAFIVVFFYTYTGILGFNLAVFDILSFFAAVLLGQIVSYKLLNAEFRGDYSDNVKGFLSFMLLLVCFIVWTYMPPELGIFRG